jgi:dihydroorotate dehydrogenase electron transfer subunit
LTALERSDTFIDAIAARKRGGDYLGLRLETTAAAGARPGQFLMVRAGQGNDPLLRRPLSLHDGGEGTLDLFFQVAGHGTALLAAKSTGETLAILGPLGNGFDLAPVAAGTDAWLVGGGRGIAPLFFLGRALRDRGARVRVFYGGRTSADLPLLDKFASAGLACDGSTDDGSLGAAGFVTALLEAELERSRPAHLFVCGPDPMMEKAAALAFDRGIDAQISLESIMGCGFGACWGCVKRIRRAGEAKWRKICEDGPVFRASEIVWERAD